MAAAVALCAPLAGRLVARRRTRDAMLIAGTALTVSCAALAIGGAAAPGWYLAAAYALFGTGIGAANEPITYAAVSGLPADRAGLAGGINSSSRMVGQVLGVAIAGAVLTANLHGPMRTGFGPAASAAWCVLAGAGYAVLLAGILATRIRPAVPAAVPAARRPRAAWPRLPGAARQLLAPPAGRHAVHRARLPWPRPGSRAAQALFFPHTEAPHVPER
jgi:MFS family permease